MDGDYDDDPDTEYEDYEVMPSGPITVWAIALNAARCVANISVSIGGFFSDCAVDFAANNNHVLEGKLFHERTAREIESIPTTEG